MTHDFNAFLKEMKTKLAFEHTYFSKNIFKENSVNVIKKNKILLSNRFDSVIF